MAVHLYTFPLFLPEERRHSAFQMFLDQMWNFTILEREKIELPDTHARNSKHFLYIKLTIILFIKSAAIYERREIFHTASRLHFVPSYAKLLFEVLIKSVLISLSLLFLLFLRILLLSSGRLFPGKNSVGNVCRNQVRGHSSVSTYDQTQRLNEHEQAEDVDRSAVGQIHTAILVCLQHAEEIDERHGWVKRQLHHGANIWMCHSYWGTPYNHCTSYRPFIRQLR